MKKRLIVHIICIAVGVLLIIANICAFYGLFPNRSGNVIRSISSVIILLSAIMRFREAKKKT